MAQLHWFILFFAFIIYGTPDKLVRGIKLKTKKYLRRKHIHTLSELKSLEQEKKELILQIKELEQKEIVQVPVEIQHHEKNIMIGNE